MEAPVVFSKTPVDIKTLIQTSNIQIYDQNKLIDKLKEHFTEEDYKILLLNSGEQVHKGCKAVIRTDDGKFATETIY